MNHHTDDHKAIIEPALLKLMLESIAPEALPAARCNPLQQRLLARIQTDKNAAESRATRFENAANQWVPFMPGIQVKLMHRSSEFQSYLLKLAPGSALPPHHHQLLEECVVLEGSLVVRDRKGDIIAGPGAFHLAPAGIKHAAIRSDSGAVIYLRGAPPDSSDIHWLGRGLLSDFVASGLRHWFQR